MVAGLIVRHAPALLFFGQNERRGQSAICVRAISVCIQPCAYRIIYGIDTRRRIVTVLHIRHRLQEQMVK
ncbi:MAG: type II toxin-antitoxin system RelE family toxin [Alphaproteobacteria bacterium]|jgi:hypothetical protein